MFQDSSHSISWPVAGDGLPTCTSRDQYDVTHDTGKYSYRRYVRGSRRLQHCRHTLLGLEVACLAALPVRALHNPTTHTHSQPTAPHTFLPAASSHITAHALAYSESSSPPSRRLCQPIKTLLQADLWSGFFIYGRSMLPYARVIQCSAVRVRVYTRLWRACAYMRTCDGSSRVLDTGQQALSFRG